MFHYSSSLSVVPAQFDPLKDLGTTRLRIWLDAADRGTILQADAAGRISTWQDKSGNRNNFTQTTAANQPSTGTTTQNGLNLVSMTSTAARHVKITTPSGFLSAGGYVFFVTKNNNQDSTLEGAPMQLWGSSGSYNHWTYNNNLHYVGIGSTARKDAISSTLNGFQVHSVKSFASDWIWRQSGISKHSTGTNTVGWGSTLFIGDNFYSWDGHVAEVIAVNGVMDSLEFNAMGRYLTDKWACNENWRVS